MKKFLINIIIAFSLFFVFDRFSLLFLDYFYPEDYLIVRNEKEKIFNINSEVSLIIGDSWASDGFLITNEKYFNLGIYHSTPFDHYFFLKENINKLNVSVVIYNLNPLMFSKPDNVSKYYPSFNKSLDYYFNSNNNFDILKYFFVLSRTPISVKYFFNKYILRKNVEYKRKIVSTKNGYLEFYNQINFSNENYIPHDLNENQVYYFKKIQNLLLDNNIKLKLTTTPVFYDNLNEYSLYFDKFLSKISVTKSQIFDCNNFNFTRRDFLNPSHLNSFGAKKFSECIGLN